MIECKIITINDATGREKFNIDYHRLEEYPWSDEVLNWYLNEGFEIKHVVQLFHPGTQGQSGEYNFYVAGWTIFLERETEEDVRMRDPDEEAEGSEAAGAYFDIEEDAS